MKKTRLTQFSPGAGCGCKIAPSELEKILKGKISNFRTPNLLVGYETHDDAAVYKLPLPCSLRSCGRSKSTSIVSTTDFFTPIVDDPFDFGRIAATNAISDIFAMGGHPILALAVLGWPLEKLPAKIAGMVIDGAREVCKRARIPLAGGHSIDISDPVFGLMVNGLVENKNIKQNSTATSGCSLFLTKPLGIGLISTAQKRGVAKAKDLRKAIELMTTLNSPGAVFATLPEVKAMTDVTGFGLLGHLVEICEGSNLCAEISFSQIPKIEGIDNYIRAKTIPGGTNRNWKSYGNKVGTIHEEQRILLADPQTSGGLLVAVKDSGVKNFLRVAKKLGLGELSQFGRLMKKIDKSKQLITVVD